MYHISFTETIREGEILSNNCRSESILLISRKINAAWNRKMKVKVIILHSVNNINFIYLLFFNDVQYLWFLSIILFIVNMDWRYFSETEWSEKLSAVVDFSLVKNFFNMLIWDTRYYKFIMKSLNRYIRVVILVIFKMGIQELHHLHQKTIAVNVNDNKSFQSFFKGPQKQENTRNIHSLR